MIDVNSWAGLAVGIVGAAAVILIAFGVLCWIMNGCHIGMDNSS